MRKEIASTTPKDLKGYQIHRHIFKILLWKGNLKSNLRTKVLLSSDGVDNIEFSYYLRGGLEKQQENDEVLSALLWLDIAVCALFVMSGIILFTEGSTHLKQSKV